MLGEPDRLPDVFEAATTELRVGIPRPVTFRLPWPTVMVPLDVLALRTLLPEESWIWKAVVELVNVLMVWPVLVRVAAVCPACSVMVLDALEPVEVPVPPR